LHCARTWSGSTSAGPLPGGRLGAQQRLQLFGSRARAQLTSGFRSGPCAGLIALRQGAGPQWARWRTTADGQSRSCWEILAQPFEPGSASNASTTYSLRCVSGLCAWLMSPDAGADSRAPGGHIKPRASDLPIAGAQQEPLPELAAGLGVRCREGRLARSPHPFFPTSAPRFRITSRGGSRPAVFGLPGGTAPRMGHVLYLSKGLAPSGQQWFAWRWESHFDGVHRRARACSGNDRVERETAKPLAPAWATSHRPGPDRLGDRCSLFSGLLPRVGAGLACEVPAGGM